jgi:putative hydrolase of the HAD superfamily
MTPSVPEPAPVALLLDADGVMQSNPPGWRDEVAAVVPLEGRDAFLADLFTSEQEAMVGRARFTDVLDEVCGRWGIAERAADLLHQWCRVDVDPAMLDLVEALRDAGTPCVLVSNQNDHRARFLRDDLAYDDRFDRVYVSCDLGTTKADPGFFTRVAFDLGAEPASLLLVDDGPANVDSARRAGLRGEVWTLDDGQERLAALLAGHGLVVSSRP